MCIMEVRPGQHGVTIAQACAHNVNTVRGDLDMFEKLLRARNDVQALSALDRVRRDLNFAYSDLIDMYGDELIDYVQSGHDHPHEITGNERVHAPAADKSEIDAALAANGAKLADIIHDVQTNTARESEIKAVQAMVYPPPSEEIARIAVDAAHRAAKYETR